MVKMLRTWASTVFALRHSSVESALLERPWAMRAGNVPLALGERAASGSA